MKVAVIGAGAAGLCCARHLKRYPECFQFQLYEQSWGVGGTWAYTPVALGSHDHVHSSVYKNLRTNLPKEVMVFPDFPFPSHLPSFLTHEDVLKYLKDYTEHHKLKQYIKFGTFVKLVKPVVLNDVKNKAKAIPGEGDRWRRFKDTVKWKVTSVDVKSREESSEEYDAILVCSGHFSDPYTPAIPGLSLFSGHMIHSHVYREPEIYKNQKVLIIGSGPSGQDICIDLSSHARQIYLCNRGKPLPTSLPENVEELPGITEIKKDGRVVFVNNQERFVDSIILTTGYLYSFPFLSEEAGLKVVEGRRVTPLYKHTFNPIHSSMAIVGVNFGYNPIPFYDYQVQWIISVWTGSQTLPDKETMIQDDEDWYRKRLQQGLPLRKAAHYLGPAQWEMIDLFAQLGKTEPLAPVIKMLYDEVTRGRHEQAMEYKSKNYTIIARDKWAPSIQ